MNPVNTSELGRGPKPQVSIPGQHIHFSQVKSGAENLAKLCSDF